MKIGIHSVPAFKPNPTGVELYAREILTRLCVLATEQKHTCICYTDTPPSQAIEHADIRVLRAPLLWTQLRLSQEMLLHAPDVLFVPGNALPQVLPKRSVITLHGLEFLQSPAHYSRKARTYLSLLTKDALRRADAIIVPSYATASALSEYFAAPDEKMHIIHHGAPTAPDVQQGEKLGEQKKPYFLYVGRLETHKNVHGLIKAFTDFMRERPGSNVELLLAGKPGFGYERIQKAIQESSARESITELGYVSEEKKWKLLSGALASVFVSFSEGFGLPVLEAQAAGTPAITSAVTAMPEVAGRGALLVDPNVSDTITDALIQVIEDKKLTHELVERGKENLKRFSWDAAAEQTLDILLG